MGAIRNSVQAFSAGGMFLPGGSVIFGNENQRPDPDNPGTLKQIFTDVGLTTPAQNPQPLDSDAKFEQGGSTGTLYGSGVYSYVVLDASGVERTYVPSFTVISALTAQEAAEAAEAAQAAAEAAAESITVPVGASITIAIDTIAELRALEPLFDGQQIELLGHTTAGIGGGVFYADFSDTTSPDNNGTVIVTSGGRRWKRKIDGYVTPEMFGAVGDWNGTTGTDDAAAISAMLDTQIKCLGASGARYLVGSNITKSNIDIDFDLNGSEIIQRGDYTPIVIENPFTDVQSVSSIGTGTVDLRNGDPGSTTTVSTLTVANGSAYRKDDIIKIVSEDIIVATDPADNEKRGEFAKVSQVSGNTVSLYSLLREEYTTGIRVAKMADQYVVKIYNGKFNSDTSVNPTWSFPLLTISGCFEPLVSIQADNTRAELLELISCLGPRTYDMSAKTQITSIANTAFGYTIVEYSCEGGTHISPKGYDCRHVYTTGALGSASVGDVTLYGSTRDFVVDGGIGVNCQNSAFDTHPDARGGRFVNCIASTPYNGPSGTQRNYQLRGIGCEISSCASIGGTGYHIFGSYSHDDAARDNTITGSTHESLSSEQTFRYAFSVEAQSGRTVKNVTISNPVVIQHTGRWSQFYVIGGEVDIINPTVRAMLVGTGQSDSIYADSGSTIKVQGGIIDYTGATDSGIRLANIQDSASSVELYGTELRSTISFYLARFNSLDGKFVGKKLRLSQDLLQFSPSSDIGVTNTGASSTYLIDYEVDNSLSTQSSSLDVTYNAGGGKTIELFGKGHDVVVINITANASGASITAINPGYFYGQELVLRVVSGSPNSIVLTSGTNTDIGSNETISAGKSYRLSWNGSNWVSS